MTICPADKVIARSLSATKSHKTGAYRGSFHRSSGVLSPSEGRSCWRLGEGMADASAAGGSVFTISRGAGAGSSFGRRFDGLLPLGGSPGGAEFWMAGSGWDGRLRSEGSEFSRGGSGGGARGFTAGASP